MTDQFASIITLLERQKTAIDKALAALCEIDGGTTPATPSVSTATAKPTGKKYKFSEAARERMRLAQRKRYADLRAASEPAPVATKTKPKFSEAAKKKLAFAMKRRWAVKRAEATAKKATAKKAVKKAVKKAASDDVVPF